jgi:hypothetical protein
VHVGAWLRICNVYPPYPKGWDWAKSPRYGRADRGKTQKSKYAKFEISKIKIVKKGTASPFWALRAVVLVRRGGGSGIENQE